jgi:hypothetical protein
MYNAVKKSPSRSLVEYLSGSNSNSQPSEKFESVNSKRKTDGGLALSILKKIKSDETGNQLVETTPEKAEEEKLSSMESDNNNTPQYTKAVLIGGRPKRNIERKVIVISDDEDAEDEEQTKSLDFDDSQEGFLE